MLFKIQVLENGQWNTVYKSKTLPPASEKYDDLYPEYENIRLIQITIAQESDHVFWGERSIKTLLKKEW